MSLECVTNEVGFLNRQLVSGIHRKILSCPKLPWLRICKQNSA